MGVQYIKHLRHTDFTNCQKGWLIIQELHLGQFVLITLCLDQILVSSNTKIILILKCFPYVLYQH